jgi:hypothetical protein
MFGRRNRGTALLAAWIAAGLLALPAQAAELKPDTLAAFHTYVGAAELEMENELKDGHFLYIDGLPQQDRQNEYAALWQGVIYTAQVHTELDGRPVSVPSGLIHHWVAVVFIRGVTLAQALAVLDDYNRQCIIYKPTIRQSKLLEHHDGEYKIFLQFYKKSLVTVVLNADFDVLSTTLDPTQVTSKAYSTRIAEVQKVGTSQEHELPVGNDHGYLWRMNNYWRVEQKDGGVYVQVESISLTRRVPVIIAWLVDPLIKSIPRSVLTQLLTATRKAVIAEEARPGADAGVGSSPRSEPGSSCTAARP